MSYVEKLSETRILWITFIATVICTVAFQVIAGRYGLILIDAISDPDQARAVIASMSESQRNLHAWVTGTLDVVYPLTYGALFIGSAYKFFPTIGRWLAAPILLLIPIDLIEGVVQILGLTDVVDWLDSKAYITSAKLVLFYFGLVMTVCGWVAWLVRRLKAPTSAK